MKYFLFVALTEGRGEARHEVGLAAICVSKPLLILCQISDSQSYINTLTKINLFDPDEVSTATAKAPMAKYLMLKDCKNSIFQTFLRDNCVHVYYNSAL